MNNTTDTCIKLERIYEIYRNPETMTAQEENHIHKCKKCQEHYIGAQVFDSYFTEEEKPVELQFPDKIWTLDDEIEDELLLAGAKRKDIQEENLNSIDFMMTYVASEKDEESEDYWKARLKVHGGDNLQIDFHVVDGMEEKLDGILVMLKRNVAIEKGVGKIDMKKEDFENNIQDSNLECSFTKSSKDKSVPGELFWTNNW